MLSKNVVSKKNNQHSLISCCANSNNKNENENFIYYVPVTKQ